uniref:Transmembrane protein n=1 Tax=Pithovirus LCPAC103 TaxID=2506588 RepID=A0A481Z5N3_9VIRU|nr:MAG: hypothetical protein LCPAC103_00710 [Pithovirus LCPAC103]
MPFASPEWILAIITLIVLVVFWLFLLNAARNQPPARGAVYCQSGKCATNIFNGVKKCPKKGEKIIFDPAIEVCNSPNSCDNLITRFAVQSDGSTDISGKCETGVECRCLAKQQCANFIVGTFMSDDGNAFQPIDTQKISFDQRTNYTNDANAMVIDPPFQIDDPAAEFCAAPFQWVMENRLWPNGCLRGTLAFLPADVKDFDVNTTPLGCVRGETCPEGQMAVWDRSKDEVVCRDSDMP